MASISTARRAGRAAVIILTLLVTLLAAAELATRCVYALAFRFTESTPLLYERVYWAVPPWVQNTSILYDDPQLGLWMRPGATRTYVNLYGPIGDLADVGRLFQSLVPDVPEWVRARPVWHLRTNSSGLRGPELPTTAAHDAFRIAVLGDSWTVGVNVEEADTYVARLAASLSAIVAPRAVEVLNFGVIGAGADTGARLLPRVLALKPDLVILAYAQNDELSVRNGRTAPVASPGNTGTSARRSLLADLELYRLWQWWRTPSTDRVQAMLHRELTRDHAVPQNDPGRGCPNPDVASTAYFATMDANIVRLEQAGVPVVLLYASVPDFASHCTLRALSALARRHRVPLVDASAILEERGRQAMDEHERRLGLDQSLPRRCSVRDAICVLLRVDMSAAGGDRRAFVMGNRPELGDFGPNRVALFDDGTHGDQRAGDRVFSRTFAFAAPGVLTYAFSNGEPASWTGLENYHLRAFAIEARDLSRLVAPPVAEFGRHVLRSDASHPDAAGHQMIADALLPVVTGTPSFASFAGGGVQSASTGDTR